MVEGPGRRYVAEGRWEGESGVAWLPKDMMPGCHLACLLCELLLPFSTVTGLPSTISLSGPAYNSLEYPQSRSCQMERWGRLRRDVSEQVVY